MLLWVFVILFSYYFSIQPFCHVLCFTIFYSKILLIPLHSLLVCSHAFSTYLLAKFSFIILDVLFYSLLLEPVPVSFVSPPFCQDLLIYLFSLYCQTCLLLCSVFSMHVFPFKTLLLVITFSVFPIQVLSFCLGSQEGYQIYHRLVLLQHKLACSVCLVQWFCLLGYLLTTSTLTFSHLGSWGMVM